MELVGLRKFSHQVLKTPRIKGRILIQTMQYLDAILVLKNTTQNLDGCM
jgi:hypothetical protein